MVQVCSWKEQIKNNFETGYGDWRIIMFVGSIVIQHTLCVCVDRALAQAVSRWLPTTAARVRSQVWSSGICGGQSGAGAGFLRVLQFPLPVFIPPNSPSS
jgi:hypothetical protein